MADKDDLTIQQALRVAEAGSLLMKGVEPRVYFELPNPECPTEKYAGYIEAANQFFFVATTFILLHEVGHQYLGHMAVIPCSDSKEEEFQADRYAVGWIKRGLGHNLITDAQLTGGTLVAMLALLLLHSDFDGGLEHPHPDE